MNGFSSFQVPSNKSRNILYIYWRTKERAPSDPTDRPPQQMQIVGGQISRCLLNEKECFHYKTHESLQLLKS